MVGVDKLKAKLQDVFDMILPPMEEEYMAEEPKIQEKKETAHAASETYAHQEQYKVAGGDPVYVERKEYEQERPMAYTERPQRPQFTVHTTRPVELSVQVFVPASFDHVTDIADDLRAQKACIVNYEKLEELEQRHISDFVNGVCYVMDGTVTRITDRIYLYVPDGVDVSESIPYPIVD